MAGPGDRLRTGSGLLFIPMKFHQSKGPGEAVFSLVLVLFSAAAFWQSYGISGFGGLTSAGVFPMLASAAMLISASVVLSRAVRSRPSKGDMAPAENPGDAPGDVRPGKVFTRDLVIVAALVAGYVAAMPYIGFVPASALFLFAAFSYLWRKGWLVSLAVTVFSVTVIYVVFRLGFQVVLPGGTWLRGVF